MKWYVVHTKPHKEIQVNHTLQNQEFETFLPLVEVWRARRRRIENEPLFSCYMFVRADPEQTKFSDIGWTPGVRHILGSQHGLPNPVPDELVEYIRHQVNAVRGEPSPFKPGEQVEITEGPFTDIKVVFEAHLSGYERSQVLVNILGRLTRYEVPTAWLKKV